ncbi:hypothetical protein FF011L_42940 [Roseimaritima multifibrata]|uniref:Uncharacterized protein n=1 Tax=Roseimaritima multifibrata TaxID=1930274 RepID=A0A517ML47_9BACT|nr:hypothetical protein [Roseimaritima multifibrata]QDS95497.1 hypothetical protein FF011L_42940 [Roseimaritima multifibrata]
MIAASSSAFRDVFTDESVTRIGTLASEHLDYQRNQQYSVTALKETTGTISERYAYDALTVLAGSGNALSESAYIHKKND